MPRWPSCADRDREAEIVKARDQTFRELGLVAAIEEVPAKVVVVHTVLEDVIGGSQDRRRDRDDGFLGPAAALQAKKLGMEVRVFLVDGDPGGMGERGLEPGVAVEGTRLQPLARGLVLG